LLHPFLVGLGVHLYRVRRPASSTYWEPVTYRRDNPSGHQPGPFQVDGIVEGIKSLSANKNLYINWYNLAPDDKSAGEMKQG